MKINVYFLPNKVTTVKALVDSNVKIYLRLNFVTKNLRNVLSSDFFFFQVFRLICFSKKKKKSLLCRCMNFESNEKKKLLY